MRRVALGDEKAIKLLKLTPETTQLMQKAYDFMQVSWEGNMVLEKGNPLKWIFFGKNHFGYSDQSEVVHRREGPEEPEGDAEEIRRRYAAKAGADPIEVEAEVVSKPRKRRKGPSPSIVRLEDIAE